MILNDKTIFSIITFLMISLSESCLKKEVENNEPPSTTPHQVEYPCDQSEVQKVACLNNGRCYVIMHSSNSRSAYCHCTKGWDGTRCEHQFIDPSYGASVFGGTNWVYDIPAIIGLVVAIVAGILLIAVIFILCCIRKNKNDSKPTLKDSVSEIDRKIQRKSEEVYDNDIEFDNNYI